MRIRRNGGDWSWITFRYERLPNFCFICGLIGHTEKFCIKLFEGFYPTSEKKFGPWLRAPNSRPSSVTGNKWVVTDQTETIPLQSQDNVTDGTTDSPGGGNTGAQSTIAQKCQHVASTVPPQPTSSSSDPMDVIMVQADCSIVTDGLIILDQKRKRTDSFGPVEEANLGPIQEPITTAFDLNGPIMSPSAPTPNTTLTRLSLSIPVTHNGDSQARLIHGFRDAVESSGLKDFAFDGHQFTWERSKGTHFWIEAKLDMILVTDSWCDLFSNAKACSVTTPKSDHMPLHLQILPPPIPNPKPRFRFENLWLRDAHCRDVMIESWSKTHGQNLMERVGRCSKAIWLWGKEFSRNFQKRLDFWRKRMVSTKNRRDPQGIS
nr:uncharacterized protein LOC109167502 [Ipomoea batatas]